MENQKTIGIPNEYKRLFDSDWREAAVYGGRYSLKSHTVARVLLIRARQNKLRVGCFREFQNSIAESSHQLLSDLIKQYELNDFVVTDKTIVNKINGSDFLFKGLWNNEQTIKSIEGIDIAWVEEAQTISRESLEVLTPTVRKSGSQLIYTYNRFMEEDPIHKRLVIEGRPNTLVINAKYDIAIKYGLMPQVILDEIEDDKEKRPPLYKHKWLGEPASSERKIFKDWILIDEIPHHARCEGPGLDFGYSNDPSTAIDVYYHDGGYILDELFYKKGMLNKHIADALNNRQYPSDAQALVVGDSAEPKSIDEIKSYGVNIVGVSKTKSESKSESFKKWSIGLVQNQRISVTKRSINLWKEYQNYLWAVDREDKILNEPEHEYSHSMDAVTYKFVQLLGKPKVTVFKPSVPVQMYYPELGI